MIHSKQHRLQEKIEEEAWLFFTENLREQEKQRSGLGWRQILCFSSSSLVLPLQLDHRVHPILILLLGCSWGVGGEEVRIGGREEVCRWSGWMALFFSMKRSLPLYTFFLFLGWRC
jgi:hypothetical protein